MIDGKCANIIWSPLNSLIALLNKSNPKSVKQEKIQFLFLYYNNAERPSHN